jgi:type II secretory pathway pseudopilin PulG
VVEFTPSPAVRIAPDPRCRSRRDRGGARLAESGPGRRSDGFTLIELVLAVGLIGGSFLALLLLRGSAIERAHRFNLQRKVQRIAQEKLEEVVYGLEPALTGSIEGLSQWDWEVDVLSLATTETLYPLLECNLLLRYPGDDPDTPAEYRVTTRFFADEFHPLREHAGVVGDSDVTGGGDR